MKIKNTLLLGLLAGTVLTGCEMPGKPDFRTSQKIEAPILYNKTFQFMGGSNALIDTTSGNMDSLFTIDDDDFILITKEQEFDFGDLNDAIPAVTVDPTSFQSQVGEITLGEFSSSGSNLGTADFQSLTGQDPSLFSEGTEITNGGATTTPVNIDIGTNTDYFVRAVIKSGALEVSVINNLGFDISAITLVLNSGSTPLGTTVITNVNHGFSSFGRIFFNEGDVLEDINVDVSVEWDGPQNMQDNPGSLVVENVVGVDLKASSVEAAVEQQTFETSNLTIFDDSEFQFGTSNHYVQLESGQLELSSILNNLDIAVDSLIISFPGIRHAPYGERDSLVIVYENAIPRSGSSAPRTVDIRDYRIYAASNEIEYNIRAVTENTQTGAGSEARVIEEDNTVSSSVSISNLEVKEAFGVIVSQNVLLGDDDYSNGEEILDLFNINETEITEIDGIDEFSSRFDGLEFTSPTLGISYTTSVGVGTTVYGAFLGINKNGNQVFLRGISGSEYEVSASDPIEGLQANGTQLTPDQLIKFELETANGQGVVSGSELFTTANTNVDDFLNNLPSEIRFIGKAVINESGQEGAINTPVQFDPVIEVGLPLAFKTSEGATFTDTSDTQISLPFSDQEKVNYADGKIIIEYENGLPLGINMGLSFRDSAGVEIILLPSPGENIQLLPSGVDADTRFADNPEIGEVIIALNREQLNLINSTHKIVISAQINSTNKEEVKLRTTDSIKMSVKAELTIEAEVKL